MQALLRRDLCRTISWSEGPPVRIWVRPASRAREASGSHLVEPATDDFCELDERSISRDIPDDYIGAVCRVMVTANWHTYQVLTKRSKRLKQLLGKKLRAAAQAEHIWWGVSVEDRRHGFPRIDDLRDAPAAVRFLSVEPLIEDLGQINLQGIQWVIVGGESGAGARPIAPEWVKSIRAQCAVNKVAFFFKQWGGVRKHETGRVLDGRTYSQFPKRAESCPPSAENRRALLARLNELTSF
jgi:protein gp37